MTAPTATPTADGPRTLRVMTHDSFALSEDVLAAFEAEHNVTVSVLQSGDAGSLVNKAILAGETPLADVLYGVDNAFLSRALQNEIFEAYTPIALTGVPAEFQLDPNHRAIPVNYGDVCLNYDKAFFVERGLSLPQTLDDLLKPELSGLLAVENPATSSPGLAFLLATIARFGEDGYLDYWAGLRANDVKVVDDWSTAYYTEFSGSSGQGPRPLVVSYASSPPAEVIFADPRPADAPTASVVGPGTCFRQIEFVGILTGTPNRDLAEAWVDFMLSPQVQQDLPLQMFVFPVVPDTPLPAEFERFSQIPAEPAQRLQRLERRGKKRRHRALDAALEIDDETVLQAAE
ncbi:MAG TPA: thiamine ABC transporter substrate-binding protein, partial [Anaerolineales bacterium]|nr:thiamine ABC transporter substrate-binding protein [Anaerolineales bacterium]